MPYGSTKELGSGKESLPEGAKKIFMAAFNAAYKQYNKNESRASAVAWAAVKRKYKKNKEGNWVAKDEQTDGIEVIDHCEPMILDDAANLQLTTDGYLVAVPRVARTGIQLYKGIEMGLGDLDAVIRVYRPEGEVFDWDAIKSLAFRPITNGHPPEMVDAKNWKKYAVGTLGGDFARDGQFIRFPMTIQDSTAVNAVRTGKAQLSVGYSSEIKWQDGETPEGEPYDAIQTGIRANHIAIVDIARGGPLLRIGDGEQSEDQQSLKQRSKTMSEREVLMRSIQVDGVGIDVPEISAQVVTRALQDRDEENKSLKTQVEQQNTAASQTLADQRKLIDTKDGEIAALKRQLAEMEMTPQKLDKLVRDRLEIVDKARTIMGDGYACDGRTDVEIKRAVVSARYGEQFAKSLSDEGITGAFGALTVDAKGPAAMNNLARAIGDAQRPGAIHSAQDAAAQAYNERNKRLQNGWRRGYQQPDQPPQR